MTRTQEHTFNVWHPVHGLPFVFKDHTFHFASALTKLEARRIVNIEGYVVNDGITNRKPQSHSGAKAVRQRKQRIS